MFRFTIRDVLWLTVVLALAAERWLYRADLLSSCFWPTALQIRWPNR